MHFSSENLLVCRSKRRPTLETDLSKQINFPVAGHNLKVVKFQNVFSFLSPSSLFRYSSAPKNKILFAGETNLKKKQCVAVLV